MKLLLAGRRGVHLAGRRGWQRTRHGEGERVFLDLLATYTKQGRNLSDKQGPSYAPKLLSAEAAAEGLSKDLLVKAMNELFADGQLKVEIYGRPSRPNSRLVEVQIGGDA